MGYKEGMSNPAPSHWQLLAEQVRSEFKALKASSKEYLQDLVRQAERVVDLRELSKMDLVYRVLRNRHGQRRLLEAGLVGA